MLEQHWIKEAVFSSLEILSTWGEVGFDVYIYWSDISEGWLRRVWLELEVTTCWIGDYQQ